MNLKPISNCLSFSSLQQLVAEGDDIVAKKLLATSNTFVLVFFVIVVIYLKVTLFSFIVREEEELENTNLKKSIEEEREHEIDVSSTNVERDDRAVEEEQDDIAIPEKETSPIVECSPLSPSPDNFIVKSIRYANYNLEAMIDRYPNLRGSLTVKSELRNFSKLRTILDKQKLAKFFRSSIFGNYLQLEDRIRFQMSLVYQLLRRQIYSHRKEEIWINYSGMSICFGMKEFAIITGLNCHNEEVYDGENMSTKTKMRRKEILEIVGRSCKRNELIEDLQSKNLSKDVKKSLCLLYFVHSFLCGNDVNTNIPKKWILLSADRKAFPSYPWGRINCDTTIKHLLKAVKTIDGKTTNLYGFPWAFMCWAFEVVPFLQKKYKVFSKQVSSPRIFRWLLATNNESIVHPWIIPTSSEMEMEFFTMFVPKKLTKDDKIEKLEMDLNGVVPIKRDIIIDEHNLDVGGGGASSPIVERVFSGVGDGGGGEFTPNVDRCTNGVDFERGGDFGDISGGFGVGTSSPIDENVPCLQETPSTKETIDLLNVRVESLEKTIVTMNAKIESLDKVIVTMKSKRGIMPSSKISHPYTPDYVKRTKRQISMALSSARKKKKGKVNETIIKKELMSGDSKDEWVDIADEGADSNLKRS
ncbi:hypothetical protein H5410_036607 [Solanum commersonii]|uniref:DUF1985 domain-containing protein n=1 Tax=Solanum commersonii TaxID=4109 RepID=A0A9J5Y650_SOLCO|nr:hypothetical protein H5410_036607 [Solanum commersonii]